MVVATHARATRRRLDDHGMTLAQTTDSERDYCFEVPAEFPIFGRWVSEPVHIAGDDSTRLLASWLAFNETAEATNQSLWVRCVDENLAAFTKLRAMNLFDSSLDLPQGDVVFSSVESPEWIKDNPPGEILDRLSAVRRRYPAATIWLHEPVYQRPAVDEAPVLLTRRMLNEEAVRARQAVWATYREMRRRFRAEFYARRLSQWLQTRWERHKQHLAISRKAMELRSCYLLNEEREDIYDYVSEARSLGLHHEADFMFMTAYGTLGMSDEEVERANAFRRFETGSIWSRALRSVQVLRQSGLEVGDASISTLSLVAIPVTMLAIYSLVPTIVLIDPILTFTRPGDEDRHWFIGHWDWKRSPDGTKTLVCLSA